MAVLGQTLFVAADTDGLAVFHMQPGQSGTLSKISLSRIDPFYYDNPLNEALSVAANSGSIYVGTLNDNGIVFGLDYANLATPRIVSIYGYEDFIETWIGVMLFSGSNVLSEALWDRVSLYRSEYPRPYDSIEQDFPPLALQSIPLLVQARRNATGFASADIPLAPAT